MKNGFPLLAIAKNKVMNKKSGDRIINPITESKKSNIRFIKLVYT